MPQVAIICSFLLLNSIASPCLLFAIRNSVEMSIEIFFCILYFVFLFVNICWAYSQGLIVESRLFYVQEWSSFCMLILYSVYQSFILILFYTKNHASLFLWFLFAFFFILEATSNYFQGLLLALFSWWVINLRVV